MDKVLESTLAPFLLGLQHVGYLVENIDSEIAHWRLLYGEAITHVRRVPEKGQTAPTHFAFLTIAGTEFEFIQAIDEPFVSILGSVKIGPAGINHLAWRVNDLNSAYDALLSAGIRAGYVTPEGIVEFGNKKMLYLDPDTTGGQLVELIEINEPDQ